MLTHHAVVSYGVLQSLYIDGFLGYLAQFSFVFELSTIFVNTRHILVYHKMQTSTLYIANGLMIVLAFFVLRVCLGGITTYRGATAMFSPLLLELYPDHYW